MSDFLEQIGLHNEGFNDEEIAQIDAAKEDLSHVVATIKLIWPRINRLMPVIAMVALRVSQHQKQQQGQGQ